MYLSEWLWWLSFISSTGIYSTTGADPRSGFVQEYIPVNNYILLPYYQQIFIDYMWSKYIYTYIQ